MHSTTSSTLVPPSLHSCPCTFSFPNSTPTIITFQPYKRPNFTINNTPHHPISNTHLPNYSIKQFKNQNHGFLRQPNSSIEIKNALNRKGSGGGSGSGRNKNNKKVVISGRNMWWIDFKAALGQRINLEGLVCSISVISRDRHLALPHVSVRDIRYIDWTALKQQGFQGVVFDKDNTLTAPYSLNLWGPLASSIESCKSVFGNNIAVFSNSAGLLEYDPDGRKARALEFMIGIKVIKHKVKKPAGTAEEVERHFGCESSRLIMVGDRPFTDIVYGNRNGFLTILTAPLSLADEPFIVKQVRKIELALVNRWSKKGLKASTHRLLPDSVACVKNL